MSSRFSYAVFDTIPASTVPATQELVAQVVSVGIQVSGWKTGGFAQKLYKNDEFLVEIKRSSPSYTDPDGIDTDVYYVTNYDGFEESDPSNSASVA